MAGLPSGCGSESAHESVLANPRSESPRTNRWAGKLLSRDPAPPPASMLPSLRLALALALSGTEGRVSRPGYLSRRHRDSNAQSQSEAEAALCVIIHKDHNADAVAPRHCQCSE